jgi:hypothetical protein
LCSAEPRRTSSCWWSFRWLSSAVRPFAKCLTPEPASPMLPFATRRRPQDSSSLARPLSHRGLAALADRSCKPDHCPHQMSPEIEARIVELRRAHPGWGHGRSATSSGESSPTLRRARRSIASRAASAHRPKEQETTPRGLQALGAIAVDGAVATVHDPQRKRSSCALNNAPLGARVSRLGRSNDGALSARFSLDLAGCSGSALRSSSEFWT